MAVSAQPFLPVWRPGRHRGRDDARHPLDGRGRARARRSASWFTRAALGRLYHGRLAAPPFCAVSWAFGTPSGLGWQSLSYSANVAIGQQAQFEGPIAWGTMAVSLTFGLGLFLLAPAGLAQAGEHWLGLSAFGAT